MHAFALVLFFSLAITGLMILTDRLNSKVRESRALISMVLGVVLAWLANTNMWTLWQINSLRYPWVGVTITGLTLGGFAILLYSIYGFFAGLNRKIEDQATQIENSELKRVA